MATPRPSVSQEVFLEAALAIADEFGPDALTTRTLGNAVGLDSTTVYRYFGSKDVLLGTLYDYVIGKAIATCEDAEGSPTDRIRAYVTAYRSAFSAHPNTSRLNSHFGDMLISGQGEAPNSAHISRLVVDAIREMGLTGRTLALAYQMIETFVAGASLLDSGARSRGMTVRLARIKAMDPGGFDSVVTDQTIVAELSEEAFWLTFDQILATIEDWARST